jgi:hypothetical protein
LGVVSEGPGVARAWPLCAVSSAKKPCLRQGFLALVKFGEGFFAQEVRQKLDMLASLKVRLYSAAQTHNMSISISRKKSANTETADFFQAAKLFLDMLYIDIRQFSTLFGSKVLTRGFF